MEPAEPRFDILDAEELTRRELRRIGGTFGLVAAAFALAAGPDVARVATPVSLRGGVLRVRCASASWASSLSLMQTQLIERIGEHVDLTQHPIRSIVATAGGTPLPRPQPPADEPLAPLEHRAEAHLARLVESIGDPVLREQVLRAAINSTRREREQRE